MLMAVKFQLKVQLVYVYFPHFLSHLLYFLLITDIMAPRSEVDIPAYDVFAPVRCLKVVDKASTLPVVNTVLTEFNGLTAPVKPYVDQTVATLQPWLDVAKNKVEESVIPRLPEGTTEAVKSTLGNTMSILSEAVEKVDTYACGGVDLLVEKMPLLKEDTPTLVKTTKVFPFFEFEILFDLTIYRKLSLHSLTTSLLISRAFLWSCWSLRLSIQVSQC